VHAAPSVPAQARSRGFRRLTICPRRGFYSKTLQPSLTIAPGTTVTVEMLTHHAGDFYNGMISGDAGVESVYDFYSSAFGSSSSTPGRTPVTSMRGATGAGDGVHILTGPIAVEGAMPGDVIAVTINDLRPRVNPNTGKTYGEPPCTHVPLSSVVDKCACCVSSPVRRHQRSCVVGLQFRCVQLLAGKEKTAIPPPPGGSSFQTFSNSDTVVLLPTQYFLF